MATAVIGLGTIGKAVATHLAKGGEDLIVASRDMAEPEAFARDTGNSIRATSVADAITQADTIIFAVWFDVIEQMLDTYQRQLVGKTVVDPSNPIKPAAGGKFERTLPDGTSSGQVIFGKLPAGAHYVKAFGTLSGPDLQSQSGKDPRVALFYATDDDEAARTAERLITTAGFAPVKAGGIDKAIDIEVYGALHTMGGLDGKLLNEEEARSAVQKAAA